MENSAAYTAVSAYYRSEAFLHSEEVDIGAVSVRNRGWAMAWGAAAQMKLAQGRYFCHITDPT